MFLKGSRLVGKVRSVRFVTSDVAVMHAVGGTVMAGQTDLDPERNSVQTLLLLASATTASGALLHSKIRGRHISPGLRNLRN
jgi:hypothetical protein